MIPNGLVLTEQNDAFGEHYNIHETGEEKFQLQRFLKLVSLEFDLIEGLANNIPNMIDVDKCDSDLLPYIAGLIGWEVNLDLPIPARRREIKNAVPFYKKKGTRVGIQTAIAAISGRTPIVEDMRYRVLMTNTINTRTADTDTPFKWLLKGLPGDPNFYTPVLNNIGIHNLNAYCIFIELPLPEPLTVVKIAKIERLMRLYNPVNTIAYIILFDAVQDEIYNFTDTITEESEDEIIGLEVEPYVSPFNFITNNPNHVTNSLISRTYSPWAMDEWYDTSDFLS